MHPIFVSKKTDPAENKRPFKIKEQLQNKGHDVAYFLVFQRFGLDFK